MSPAAGMFTARPGQERRSGPDTGNPAASVQLVLFSDAHCQVSERIQGMGGEEDWLAETLELKKHMIASCA